MPFELQQVTEVAFTNSNPRSEFHGEDHVRAIDISMTITGDNTLLDLFEPGLREHEYTNRDLKAGQQPLPDVVIPLPHLRFPKLPERVAYAKGEKVRGYRFVIDYGLGEEAGSNVDLTDCAVGGQWYEKQQGGTVTLGFSVHYNGDELNDDRLYGRLAGVATLGKGHVQLLAPPTLIPVSKGWRSGKADTPPLKNGGGELFSEVQDEGTGEREEHPEGTPEEALAATETNPVATGEAEWPFPLSAHEEKPKGRRGRRAEARVQ